jgi:hypothetical protein
VTRLIVRLASTKQTDSEGGEDEGCEEAFHGNAMQSDFVTRDKHLLYDV